MVKISDSRRAELKKPLGILIADKDITAEAIAKHAGVDASYITVGDASTERASTLGLNVCMEIVDCLEKRVSRSAPNMRENFTIVRCTNLQGTFQMLRHTIAHTMEYYVAVSHLICRRHTALVVIPHHPIILHRTFILHGSCVKSGTSAMHIRGSTCRRGCVFAP